MYISIIHNGQEVQMHSVRGEYIENKIYMLIKMRNNYT